MGSGQCSTCTSMPTPLDISPEPSHPSSAQLRQRHHRATKPPPNSMSSKGVNRDKGVKLDAMDRTTQRQSAARHHGPAAQQAAL